MWVSVRPRGFPSIAAGGDEYRAPQQGDGTRRKGAGGEQVQRRHPVDRRPCSGCAEPETDSGSDAHRFGVIAEEFGQQVRSDFDEGHLPVRIDGDADVDALVDKQLIVVTEVAVKFVHGSPPLGDLVAPFGEFVGDAAGLVLTGGCF